VEARLSPLSSENSVFDVIEAVANSFQVIEGALEKPEKG
jgi:hypothetical protein